MRDRKYLIRPLVMREALALGPQDRLFVLTGAGISAESGLRTFRDGDGLWESQCVEDVATPEAWARDPELVWRFYSARRQQAAAAEPNAAHRALAALEAQLGDRLFLCTQNVDDLHERAGSQRVVHMHGELFRSRLEIAPEGACPHARGAIEDRQVYASLATVPRCACGYRLRPHICWFGEMPYAMDEIAEALGRCTHFLCVGSSGAVYPAAGFVHQLNARGVPCDYLGPEPPDNATAFTTLHLGTATALLPALFGASRNRPSCKGR